MGSRLGLRLLGVILLGLVALQVAFGPVRMIGWIPEFQRPSLRLGLGLDLQGGSRLVLEAKDAQTARATPEAVEAAMRIIQNRIDQLGVVEPTVQRQGSRRIVVELPGIQDPGRAIALIGKTALLEFVDTGDTQLPRSARWSADGKTVRVPSTGERLQLEKKVVLTGANLAEARASFDRTTVAPLVRFRFVGSGADRFEEFTGKHIGKYLTIVLDNEVISSPVIRNRITGGTGQISGGFKGLQDAHDLAVLLRAGALPVPVQVVENRSVGPLLGRDSIEKSFRAGLIAAVAVVVFMGLYYGFSGVLADIALGLYIVLVLAVLSLLGATLTLPAITGLILSIGVAVDANVIIYEKVKEELRAGKTLRAALQWGWNRAFVTIIDSNVTTLLAAVVLFLIGSGPIRGFAVTLIVGVLASMLTAIIVTRILVDLAVTAGLSGAILRLGVSGRGAIERA